MRLSRTLGSHSFTGKESGIFIPIVAVMALAILAVLIGLGFDTSKVKRASTALGERGHAICRVAAAKAVVQREAVQSFSDQVNTAVAEKSIKNVSLTRAKIILPTMPDDGSFCSYGNTSCAHADPFVKTSGVFEYDLAAMGIVNNPPPSTASNWCASNCYFKAKAEGDPKYPSSLWSDLWNAGNTAACEFEGTVETIFSGQRTISVKATWWLPVRAKINFKTQKPGLTIAIAPHMTTRASDPRFRFCNPTEPNCGSGAPWGVDYPGGASSFRNRHDPLYDYEEGGGTGLDGFSPAPANILPSYPNGKQHPDGIHSLVSPLPISGVCRSQAPTGACQDMTTQHDNQRRLLTNPALIDYAELPVCPGPADPGRGSTCAYPSDREEMLAACMNPAILLRNLFLSQIIEFASRHGQYRMNSEVLLVGTQNRPPVSNNPNMLSRVINSPTTIVAYGEDLTAESYQVPYVFYDSGESSLVDPARTIPETVFGLPYYGSSQGGWIDPFATSSHPDPSLKEHHALIANQLRMCYHLYYGTDHGLQRAGLDSGSGLLHDIDNTGFEPFSFNPAHPASAYSFSEKLRSNLYTGGSDPWDQDCPWGAAGCPDDSGHSRGLNAAEVVSMLGSIQKCPYEQGNIGGANYFTDTANVCTKPNSPFPRSNATDLFASTDLRPDLLGLVYYLAGKEPPGAVSGDTMKAVNAPGMFPINYGAVPSPPTLAEPDYPMGAANYSAAPDPATTPRVVLIVTSQRITQGERNALEDFLKNNRELDGFTFLIAYFPTDELDSTELTRAIADFQKAFLIDPTAPEKKNVLFVFSPHLSKYDGMSSFYPPYTNAAGADADWKRFRRYWKDFLTSNTDNNIYSSARNIFYYMSREDLKF